MIYITGDTHGPIDFNKLLRLKNLKVTRRDILFILGDAGICWDPIELKMMDIIYSHIGCTIYFIDGNHENFDMLEQFPIIKKYGAKMHMVSKYIYHIKRGEILKIKNIKILCIGGAFSIDRWHRREGISWWPQEEITKSDIDNALTNLEKVNNKVDYTFTHCVNTGIVRTVFHFKRDDSTDWLNVINRIANYKYWLFGHYHFDRDVARNKKCIYKKIYFINANKELEELKDGNE